MRFHGLFLSIWLGTSCLTAADREGDRLFALKVRGILNAKCLACHGEAGKKLKGDLDLSSRAAMLKGGESEEASLVPGKPLASPLYLAATREHEEDWSAMPPKENDKLTADQLAVLKRWIDLGAPWPDAKTQARYIAEERAKPVTAEGVLVKTSGGTSEDWTYRRYRPEDVWAFQPVVKPKVPQGAANPVDAFINRKLKSAGFARAPQADFRTLVKRAYYDLTGLPPTPFEIFQFRQAWNKDPVQAWAALIDRLLASPHYGERWGQHWLDVARYADTGGYSNDYERSNMWRYRDYVIRAFNEDKPYDEFIREQIAGDELADASLRRRISDWNQFQNARQNGKLYNARESEQLVASSFLRMGPWDPEMVKKPQARQIYLDDVVNAVGETFLSTTMRCFKCHDHKFDPLPTRDYYRMYAVFEPTQLAERPAPFFEKENRAGFKEGEAATRHLLSFATDKHNALYNFLSAPGLSVNVKTEEAIFTLHGGALRVNGSFLTEAHITAQLSPQKLATASFWASELDPNNFGWRVINGSCVGRAFRFGNRGKKDCFDLKMAMDYSSATFAFRNWTVTVRGTLSCKGCLLAGPAHRLDIGFAARGNAPSRDKPHGIIGSRLCVAHRRPQVTLARRSMCCE